MKFEFYCSVYLSTERKFRSSELTSSVTQVSVSQCVGMGLEEIVAEPHFNGDKADRAWTISVHTFSDITCISPVVFLYLMKACYINGTCKATRKFRALQHQVNQALCNSPQPGPATFIARCLYVLPIFGFYSEGFSHLIISALRRHIKGTVNSADSSESKNIATHLFLDIVGGFVEHDEKIIVKILETFDVRLTDIEKAISQLKAQNKHRFESARTFIEQYIFALIESSSYMTAVSLLEHFSIRKSGESFLFKMIHNKQFKAAEKWSTFMGKPMICLLVQEYAERNMLKSAYETIKKNNLQLDFPEVYHKCRESSLKKLAEKACWDVAEAKTKGDRRLLEYLVYLAMEAGYSEKVDELCERHSLEGFLKTREPEAGLMNRRFLDLKELVVEDIIWVDEVDGLRNATCHIEEFKVVGIDCEWKPNYEKGSRPNKVSIMQMASDKMVFVFDLIRLFKDVPDVLDCCLTRILQSPGILKLGYNFRCDIKQLAHSYEDLKCFKHYEMLLDIQNVFKEPQGGLSGLANKILGAGLNKTRRNSNWELRPLSPNQLEYAALDAVVLIHIFDHVRNHTLPTSVSEGHDKIEWKSYSMDNPKKLKKRNMIKKETESVENERWLTI